MINPKVTVYESGFLMMFYFDDLACATHPTIAHRHRPITFAVVPVWDRQSELTFRSFRGSCNLA
jgi:hypothetical protein